MVNESHIDTGSKLAQYHPTPVQIFMKNHAGINPKGVHVYERSDKCQPWTSWHIKRNSNNISIGFPLGIPAGFTTLPQPDCERGKALVNYWHCESAIWHDVSRHCESATLTLCCGNARLHQHWLLRHFPAPRSIQFQCCTWPAGSSVADRKHMAMHSHSAMMCHGTLTVPQHETQPSQMGRQGIFNHK